MLGQRLKQARIEAGLSQRQLCGEVITRNMLSQIESGKARPSMPTLTYLAQMLGKPVSWFLDEPTVQVSGQQEDMTAARELYDRKGYDLCLEALEKTEPTPESLLLRALCDLALAGQAIGDGKMWYARSLLEQAGEAGSKTCYFTPALERERLLLLYQAQPEKAGELARVLPKDDRELLLRAEGCLTTGDCEGCVNILGAVTGQKGQYHYLLGKALLGQKQYTQAVEHFLLTEQNYPRECAHALETCYRELGDYKMAYHYACKQRI